MTLYIVFGTTGEYSERDEWLVKAFKTEQEAQDFVLKAEQIADDIFYKRENKYREGKTEKHKLDKQFYMSYTGTKYYYEPVELVDN